MQLLKVHIIYLLTLFTKGVLAYSLSYSDSPTIRDISTQYRMCTKTENNYTRRIIAK